MSDFKVPGRPEKSFIYLKSFIFQKIGIPYEEDDPGFKLPLDDALHLVQKVVHIINAFDVNLTDKMTFLSVN